MQKLVYFAYGRYWALHDKRLFKESIEAWDCGPVVPEVYHKLKRYKNRPIHSPTEYVPDINDSEVKSFLKKVFNQYNSFSANQLCDLTHMNLTPWHMVYNDGTENNIINDHLIKVYFSELKIALESNDNQFAAAKLLSKDQALIETMHILSYPSDAEKLKKAMKNSSIDNTVDIDRMNAI